jgi:hypothetical protein
MLGKESAHPMVVLKSLIFVPPNVTCTFGFNNQTIKRFPFHILGMYPNSGLLALRDKRTLVNAAAPIQLIHSRRTPLGFDS